MSATMDSMATKIYSMSTTFDMMENQGTAFTSNAVKYQAEPISPVQVLDIKSEPHSMKFALPSRDVTNRSWEQDEIEKGGIMEKVESLNSVSDMNENSPNNLIITDVRTCKTTDIDDNISILKIFPEQGRDDIQHQTNMEKNIEKAFIMTQEKQTKSRDKPYSCSICSKTFSKSKHLTLHIRTHTGDMPYKCSVCDKHFNHESVLQIHMRTHTGDKPYMCIVCPQSFTNSSHLTVHMRTHTGDKPYLRTVCHKSFSQSSILKVHKRIHTGDKPYTCTACPKSFTYSSHLTLHMRTHTGDKPYTCTVCSKLFTISSTLTRHMRTHT
jgi:uncharacterized Zn-finger protein